MKCHLYITPWATDQVQLTTIVDLADNALDLPNEQLLDTIDHVLDKKSLKKSAGLFKKFTIDGVRECSSSLPLPTPIWLSSEETKDIFVGPHAISGTPNEFYWREFLASIFTCRWLDDVPWKTNAAHVGYPQLSLVQTKTMRIQFASDGKDNQLLRNHLPPGWTIASRSNQGHLGISHPGLMSEDLSSFITTRLGEGNLLPARTHPLFYLALYQFWQYLNEQPLWSHLCPNILVRGCRTNSQFDAQDLVGLGLSASTYRWGWWSFMNHLFAPGSRALSILEKDKLSYQKGATLFPRPEHLSLNNISQQDIPRLRILSDPYSDE